jgi:hypothetical protein
MLLINSKSCPFLLIQIGLPKFSGVRVCRGGIEPFCYGVGSELVDMVSLQLVGSCVF